MRALARWCIAHRRTVVVGWIVALVAANAIGAAVGSTYNSNYKGPNSAGSQQAMLRSLELTPAMHRELLEHCKLRGIAFFSTAFDIESLDLLAGLGLDRFKIPSGEITNLPYLRHVGGLGKPLIMSTGMATMDEIAAALAVLEKVGAARDRITVLHCNSQYPTPMADVNLRAMLAIRDCFGVKVGYSDHTLGIEVAIAAVALGASVIEINLEATPATRSETIALRGKSGEILPRLFEIVQN